MKASKARSEKKEAKLQQQQEKEEKKNFFKYQFDSHENLLLGLS